MVSTDRIRRCLLFVVAFLMGLGAWAFPITASGQAAGEQSSGAPSKVTITAVNYGFEAPDTIPAGWTHFELRNRGSESHQVLFYRLPEGRTFTEFQNQFEEPADSIMQLVAEGRIDSTKAGSALREVTAAWAHPHNLNKQGGVGLVASGRTGRAIHHIGPGNYVMTCLMDDSTGRPHAAQGMADSMTVVNERRSTSPPESDVTVRSEDRTLHTQGKLVAGKQVVRFVTGEPPEGGPRKFSAWLARITGKQEVTAIEEWRFHNPAPATFLGGFEYLPSADTAYIEVTFRPGTYAWMWFYEGQPFRAIVDTFAIE